MRNLRVVIIIAIIAVIALFIGSAIRSWYLFLKEPVAPVTDALPPHTTLIIRTNSVNKLFESVGNSALSDLLGNKGIYAVMSNTLDSLAVTDKKLSALLDASETVFSFSETDKGKQQLLVAVGVGKTSPSAISKRIGELMANSGYTVNKSAGSFYTIADIRTKAWFYVSKGVFVITADSVLMQESFNTLQSGNGLTKDAGFVKLMKSTGKSSVAGVIINNKLFARSVWPAKAELLSKGTPFDGWSSFDITIRKGEVSLGGFTFTPSGHLFTGQEPVEFDNFSDFPSNTALLLTLGFSDRSLYTSGFNKKDTMHVKGYDASIRQETDEIFRPADHLRSWIGNTVSLVYSNDYFRGDGTSQMVMISSRDRDSALYYLRPYIQPVNDSLGRLHFKGLAPAFWGKLFTMKGELWCIVTSKYVAIAPERDILDKLARSGRMSAKEVNAMKEVAGQTSNLFVYIRPETVAKWLKTRSRESDNLLVDFLGSNRSIGLQYSADKELQYTHAWMMLNPSKNKPRQGMAENLPVEKETITSEENIAKSETGKAVKTESEIDEIKEIKIKSGISSIQVVSGPTRHSKYITVLSKNDVLRVFDHTGKELWKFECPEDVNGKILEADIQKNGKINYLLIGRKHLYILNQQGEQVAGSPVKLPKAAAGGASLVDYDNRKDYRLLYVATDDRIYNITLKGRELPDWQKPVVSGDGVITFHRLEGKDYLVYQDSDKQLRIYDRRGKERIKMDQSFAVSANTSLFENKTNSKGSFLTVTPAGELAYLNREGKVSKSSFGTFGRNPWFTYTDFNADGSMDFIFSGSNRITAFTKMKDVIAEKTISKGTFGTPFIYLSSAKDKWIFARNTATGQVIGFNNKGKDYPGNIISETDPVIFNPGGKV